MGTQRHRKPYPLYGVRETGARELLPAYELVMERPVGPELELELMPHPNLDGYVTFAAYKASALISEPASGGDVYIYIESWPQADRRRGRQRQWARGTLSHLYTTDVRGLKTATTYRRFAVELPQGARLDLDFSPKPPWARHIHAITYDGPIKVAFGAARELHVGVAAARSEPSGG